MIPKYIQNAKRIVIKIGSALLFDPVRGEARKDWMKALAADVAALHSQGSQVLLISSGSIALGRRHLGLSNKTIRLEEKQAAAATGQVELAQLWSEALADKGLRAGQILLAPEDTETRRRHINARATIQTLLDLGVVPVVNENDTVTTYEIRFGDNDRLAARVAAMVSADLLILLSDVDGL
ncbi:MAG: glutamate 5-kinase, partial [Alphaproteobacteria bacterium]|nr:glutamate 5-kinase [Alphaproteobacteria bacterium]